MQLLFCLHFVEAYKLSVGAQKKHYSSTNYVLLLSFCCGKLLVFFLPLPFMKVFFRVEQFSRRVFCGYLKQPTCSRHKCGQSVKWKMTSCELQVVSGFCSVFIRNIVCFKDKKVLFKMSTMIQLSTNPMCQGLLHPIIMFFK